MLFTTPTQFAALICLFVAGWLLGLASHPGGRKWKDRYLAERDAHAGVRKDGDARVSDANRRITELERENARLASAPPVAAAPVVAPVTERVVERRDTVVAPSSGLGTSRRVVRTPGERRGWFDFGGPSVIR
ncbi:hypothetical protein ACT009_15735 [Sphingomonas sp. Tas61C01]|uniref:hypothetical protein n=1 Tax=Sphingomonas sp. Tas61C01 TaxID=3458297 RepID=UPI00403E9ED8